jgi:hypothetical protein
MLAAVAAAVSQLAVVADRAAAVLAVQLLLAQRVLSTQAAVEAAALLLKQRLLMLVLPVDLELS